MAIDTSSRMTHAKQHLLDYIDKNQMNHGDQLPSEAEMARTLGVSRNTIREAYITLEAEGAIVRKHGIGTFVSRSPMITNSLLRNLSGFPQMIKDAGFTAEFQNLVVEKALAPAKVYDALNSPPTTKLLKVERVYLADGNPAIYIIDFFPHTIDDTQLVWETFEGDMVQFITDAVGINYRHLHTRIHAVTADAVIAASLNLSEGRPIICNTSTLYNQDNIPFTYAIAYFNPDIIELDIMRMINNK